MKYIFVTGAPGSKWSSVVKNIYYSPSIDRSDYSEARTYYHDASGTMELMHLGAYFDPGMESHIPEDLRHHSRETLEEIFDSEFVGNGVRIIKSHSFSNHLDFIRATWPDCPIVLVHRSDDACLGWWVKCGHFDITYPSYKYYFVDFKTMAARIKEQNLAIALANHENIHRMKKPLTNIQLCEVLGIEPPPENYIQHYSSNNIKVTVI